MSYQYFKYYLIIAILLFFVSCNKFDYSPYDLSSLKENETNLNTKNIEKLSLINLNVKDTFCFAVISDTHFDYDILEKTVYKINNDKEALFLIHLGDITDNGLLNEFKWINEKLSKLKIPYITIIGNHDYLSNGKKVYKKMYGETNFTFTFNKIKFICFDDIVWENNNNYPDFNWLNINLSNRLNYNQVFVLSHIPPIKDQIDDYFESTYGEILLANNVNLSLFGHTHSYSLFKNEDKVWYFIADNINARVYYKIYVYNNGFNIKSISF